MKKVNPLNVRNSNKDVKLVEMGGEQIMIDSKMAEKENNRAEK